MDEIKLVQVPVITHKLQEAGRKVSARLAELNIDNLVANENSVKSLKNLRAELNKELKNFEEQRKFVKNGIMEPYAKFEGVYKEEIAEKYSGAIEKLKEKISLVENKIKDEKKASVVNYFNELCQSENIDFLTFDRLNIDINLSTSLKAYKEEVALSIEKVKSDIQLINTQEHPEEILVEYKKTMNVSQSIQDVQTRKENERKEKEKARFGILSGMGMTLDSETNTFVYNDHIYISYDKVIQADKDVFQKEIGRLKEEIKEDKLSVKKPEPQKEAVQQTISEPTSTEPLSAPKVEEKLEVLTTSFEVKATMPQLKLLVAFMKQNDIQYKNID
jgi:hypothetical protein